MGDHSIKVRVPLDVGLQIRGRRTLKGNQEFNDPAVMYLSFKDTAERDAFRNAFQIQATDAVADIERRRAKSMAAVWDEEKLNNFNSFTPEKKAIWKECDKQRLAFKKLKTAGRTTTAPEWFQYSKYN